MNLKPTIRTKDRAVALVITLLMLAVITFLAVAFLAMTSRDKSAVSASLDQDTARSMSDAALARAQTEVLAQMMTPPGDILRYDYMASHNYISQFGFFAGNTNSTNVSYDGMYNNGGILSPYNAFTDPANWAQNIANLYYDPRPPVFVLTNGALMSNDFRFWVDIDRNGTFESNGLISAINSFGQWDGASKSLVNGEPEWIGVLKYPEYVHSATNPFVGRYAYMVLPIGKTLDWNYIHNHSKFALTGNDAKMQVDGFIRDEGVGSWELNLAAMLNEISPAMYQNNLNYSNTPYAYNYYPSAASPNGGFNSGAFYDASEVLAFRYGFDANYPTTLYHTLGNSVAIGQNVIDEYGLNPSEYYPYDYVPLTNTLLKKPWPGGYNSNLLYDVQDLFDTSKTGPNFSADLSATLAQIDTTNRYAFQRLLACIGTGSSPEYGVYVYTNFYTTNLAANPIPAQTNLRTKVNINYDNTAQIQAGPFTPYGSFTPMSTNLVSWTNTQTSGLNFFTNAAESLLRSQVFIFTNSVQSAPGMSFAQAQPAAQFGYIYTNFGATNIPVYVANQPGIYYNEQVHRMLQLAANIFAAAYPSYSSSASKQIVQQPPVFRPIFQLVNGGTANAVLSIVGYTNVTGLAAYQQIYNGNWKDRTDPTILPNDNVWGVPWVIGTVKGNPAFDQYSYQSRVFMQRKLQFLRYPDPANPGNYLTNKPPQYTNQFYEFSVSHYFGMDAWNPYANNFYGSSGQLVAMASNFITITLTNNYRFRTNIYVTNVLAATDLNALGPYYWAGGTPISSNMFKSLLVTNFTSLPLSFFSESSNAFVQATNGQLYPNTDTNQTTYPTHYWTLCVTNHLYYALFDGPANSGNVLDFVNLGPFGSTFNITSNLVTNTASALYCMPNDNWWTVTNATDAGTSQISQGVLNQIFDSEGGSTTNAQFAFSLIPSAQGYDPSVGQFGPPPAVSSIIPPYLGPFINLCDSNIWMASDPFVHFTLGDLTYPGYSQQPPIILSTSPLQTNGWSSSVGGVTARYTTGAGNGNMSALANGAIGPGNIVFGDPGITNANNWQFPTNLFPGVGWLGRVHRGTPWQTIYLKPDDLAPAQSYANWTAKWVASQFTYPTNDWSLIDLFTAVPNDNAARGLLSVNQTNDAAWAAVFAGIIAITNSSTSTAVASGVPIAPDITSNFNFPGNVYYLMDYINGVTNGINYARTNQPNGLFHKIGNIVQATALTTDSAFIANAGPLNDEMVERIPQQSLSLLKVGFPQFVIYSWGQSLKPKNLYSPGLKGLNPLLNNICTNYEITGEFLTRTVCHLMSDPSAANPRIVVDSYNIEPGN